MQIDGKQIKNLTITQSKLNLTTPLLDYDAATKEYVDNYVDNNKSVERINVTDKNMGVSSTIPPNINSFVIVSGLNAISSDKLIGSAIDVYVNTAKVDIGPGEPFQFQPSGGGTPRAIGSEEQGDELYVNTELLGYGLDNEDTIDFNYIISTSTASVPNNGEGSTYSFTNALSESDGVVKLGGDLIEDTNIQSNTELFTITADNGSSDSLFYLNAEDGIALYVNSPTDNFTFESSAGYLDVSSSQSITLGSNNIILDDQSVDLTQKGTEYTSDYTVNWDGTTPDSMLTTKGYVDRKVLDVDSYFEGDISTGSYNSSFNSQNNGSVSGTGSIAHGNNVNILDDYSISTGLNNTVRTPYGAVFGLGNTTDATQPITRFNPNGTGILISGLSNVGYGVGSTIHGEDNIGYAEYSLTNGRDSLNAGVGSFVNSKYGLSNEDWSISSGVVSIVSDINRSSKIVNTFFGNPNSTIIVEDGSKFQVGDYVFMVSKLIDDTNAVDYGTFNTDIFQVVSVSTNNIVVDGIVSNTNILDIRQIDIGNTSYGYLFNLSSDSNPFFSSQSFGTYNLTGGVNSFTSGYRNLNLGKESSIISGNHNTIPEGLINVNILGSDITAVSSNTTYVDNLNVSTLGGGTSVNTLGLDSDGNVVISTSGSPFARPFEESGLSGGGSYNITSDKDGYIIESSPTSAATIKLPGSSGGEPALGTSDKGWRVTLINGNDVSGTIYVQYGGSFDYWNLRPSESMSILWDGTEFVIYNFVSSSYTGAYNRFGQTSERPTLNSSILNFNYFDTDLGKPIWWKASTTQWVDYSGTVV